MIFDLKSYRHSHIFGYIIYDFELIMNMFKKNIKPELTRIENIDNEIETQRRSIDENYLDTDIYSLEYDQISNLNLKEYFVNATLLYYYSQLEKN